MKKKKGISKRDLIEFGVIVTLFAIIFLTGSQAEVFGRVQQVILKTGIMNASTLDEEDYLNADYRFTVQDEFGQSMNIEDLRGKTIFINIWATWCPPCVAEMPSINSLYQDFIDDEEVAFIMISQDRDFQKAKDWKQKRELDLPIYQLKTRLPDVYETGVVPSTFVISPEGKIVAKKTGLANYDTKRYRKLLSGS